jgi:Arm domain-containing DNA-binding protein
MDLPKIKVFLFIGKTYKDGTHPIMIRVTQNRKNVYKSVGHSVTPDAWVELNNQEHEKDNYHSDTIIV